MEPLRPGGRAASVLGAALALYALYWVLFVVQPQIYRVSFLLIAVVAAVLAYPAARGPRRPGTTAIDAGLVAVAVAAFGWPLLDFSRFVYRAAEPARIDVILGAAAILLVLEAARRTVGWILPVTASVFLGYAAIGPALDRVGLSAIAHRGYGLERLIGTLYMSLDGIFGVPLDVAATYIILFTIYGAVLEESGAGRFFIDWAMSASGRSRAAPARSVTIAGFLLGTVSGSGVATTVTLGSVAWPILRRAGYPADAGAAMLSAAGIGALLSPPTLGAAAFLIAEFLQISYLQVLVMATVPTVLYYLSIFLMVEADARGASRAGEAAVEGDPAPGPGSGAGHARRYWYHFTSLAAVAAFMVAGMSAFRAVFWATLLAVALSWMRRETAMTPARIVRALQAGGRDVLGVAATTAAAGIIVGVVTLTGLGLKVAELIVAMAGGQLVLTVLYAAAAVWLLGLAVPVTASYIIAAVMVAPALVESGIPDFAAHMFIFYYAVLSEVSPPTALSPFAAAAITGANPFRTMLLTWRYTLPAFVVPFVFTLSPRGTGVLLQGTYGDMIVASTLAAAGVAAIAIAAGGRAQRERLADRALLAAAGLMFLYGSLAACVTAGALLTLVFLLHFREHAAGSDAVPRR